MKYSAHLAYLFSDSNQAESYSQRAISSRRHSNEGRGHKKKLSCFGDDAYISLCISMCLSGPTWRLITSSDIKKICLVSAKISAYSICIISVALSDWNLATHHCAYYASLWLPRYIWTIIYSSQLMHIYVIRLQCRGIYSSTWLGGLQHPSSTLYAYMSTMFYYPPQKHPCMTQIMCHDICGKKYNSCILWATNYFHGKQDIYRYLSRYPH